MPTGWQFWIDRGGTFTDVIGCRPDGILVTHKLLSENAELYEDAAIAGIEHILRAEDVGLHTAQIAAVKMGTTVATNALLERKGERTVLAITKGFSDALRIGYQNRPDIFARHIVLPSLLHDRVIELDERIGAHGTTVRPLDETAARTDLQRAFDDGYRSVAIVCIHGYRYPDHEARVAAIAQEIGFSQISTSHDVSALMKLVSRGDTTVVDAYLSPVLRRYINRVKAQLPQKTQISFMQSNGGLATADQFQGKDAILSGPAGGIVGMTRTAEAAGIGKIIGFDMGGTSTDVSHYAGHLERNFETTVAGVRLRAPMLNIHTIAAGGGSICRFEGGRMRVGPESAGADPGPACYGKGGPLTITDCNVHVGKIQPSFFPHLFGPDGKQGIDTAIVAEKFESLAKEIEGATGIRRETQDLAQGFLAIAVGSMANAIKKISVARGHDVTDYTLVCFGGAAGQHACLVADALGMRHIMIHPLAGVLSAYGMGLAEQRLLRQRTVEAVLSETLLPMLQEGFDALEKDARATLGETDAVLIERHVAIKYQNTDTALEVSYGSLAEMTAAFTADYLKRFAFSLPHAKLVAEAIVLEAVKPSERVNAGLEQPSNTAPAKPEQMVVSHMMGAECETPIFDRDLLAKEQRIAGPAIIFDRNATTVVEPGWEARSMGDGVLMIERHAALVVRRVTDSRPDPLFIELFNNAFMAIAEQMGMALQNTAHSVNIKERLDFSCALFDAQGALIANAPHMPVHLGSMGDSVRAIREAAQATDRGLHRGDVYALNNPYNGGTHLPDITVVAPVFSSDGDKLLFFVAARGHHADIGGISPGSMPPDSVTLDQEGILIDNFLLVEDGTLREAEFRALLGSGRYPARNPDQNIGDIKAQVAACARGAEGALALVADYGAEIVLAYIGHVQDNAEYAVRDLLGRLSDGSFTYESDDGSRVSVSLVVDKVARRAVVDFAGTSGEQPTNMNAPSSVCRAAVLYVVRSLLDENIPLNDGCLRPVEIRIPEPSMLKPSWPAAVVAGNVETSQVITDALYGATGLLAAAQGTMNNFTFGNATYQYYETICGGSGAGPGFDGTDAVHTHMTNSRLTDAEVLEWRYPVLVEDFRIRKGSGGAGFYRGGNGIVRKIRFLEAMEASILSNRRSVPPFGLAGGEPARVGRNAVERASGIVQELGPRESISLHAGDAFIIETPGGGGYGA